MRSIGFIIIALMIALPAAAQSQEKAEIDISNNRAEPIVMRFDYAFRQYSWRLIEHTIDEGDDIVYRYPSNIPGCEKLHEWGIADGILTISNSSGPLCQKRVSLCDKSLTRMNVGERECTWRQTTPNEHPRE